MLHFLRVSERLAYGMSRTVLPSRVHGLVLLNTGAVLDGKRHADVCKRMASRNGEPWCKEAAKAFEMNPRSGDFAAMSASVVALAGTTMSEQKEFDVRSDLKKVTAPALIVVGEDDFMCSPESATILHLALPNSKLLVIEDCGHFPWMKQPEVLNTWVPQLLAALELPVN